MRSVWAAVFSLIMICEAQGAQAASPAEQALGKYRVIGIRPRLFLHESGVLETEEASRAGGPNMMLKAEAMLVLVDIVGPQFPAGKGGRWTSRRPAGIGNSCTGGSRSSKTT